MNKVFIGLLVVAAGAGVFFYFRKKNKETKDPAFKKEWIIGKWEFKAKDSAEQSFHYQFDSTGTVLKSVSDTIKADTLHYSWDKKNKLVFGKTEDDSTAKIFSIVKLTSDTLQIQSKDSVITLFTKVK